MVENIKIAERAKRLEHKRVIVDASAIIKMFFQEEESDLMRAIMGLNEIMELSLFAPPLIFFEFLNVLSIRLKDTRKVQRSLKEFFKFNIGIISPKYGYLERAIENACELSNSYYDSAYHALAKEMNGIFLTADKKYFGTVKDQGNILLLGNL